MVAHQICGGDDDKDVVVVVGLPPPETQENGGKTEGSFNLGGEAGDIFFLRQQIVYHSGPVGCRELGGVTGEEFNTTRSACKMMRIQ
jgi:hypothetical protein